MSKQRKKRRSRVTTTASTVPHAIKGPVPLPAPEVTKEARAAADAVLAQAETVLREAEVKAARTRAEADAAAAQIVSLAEAKAADITAAAQADATTRAQAQVRACLKAAEESADDLREQARREARDIVAAAETTIADRRAAAEKAFAEAQQNADCLIREGREKAASLIADAQQLAGKKTTEAEELWEQARAEHEKAQDLRKGWEAKARTKPKPADSGEILRLSAGEIVIFAVVIALAGVVGTLGLYSSFDSVAAKGAQWGFGGKVWLLPDGWILPVGIDLAIPAFTGAHLLLIRKDMPLSWVRFVPWVLSAVTCYLNTAAVTDEDTAAHIAHGVMPALWVVLSEVAAHAYASYIGVVTGRRMDKIRLSRWLLAFPSTSALWRRMVLWEITSYAQALDAERERRRHNDRLRARYGRLWRWKAPQSERFSHVPVRDSDDQVPDEAQRRSDTANSRGRMHSAESERPPAKPSAKDRHATTKTSQAKADLNDFAVGARATKSSERAAAPANARTNPAPDQLLSPVGGQGVPANEPASAREQAKAEVREAFANGRSVDSKELSERHGFSQRWAQLLIKEVRRDQKGEANGTDREARPARGETPESERKSSEH